MGDGPRGSCSRAALAVWVRKLHITSPIGDEISYSPIADEALLDWLVTSVRGGWTPRDVLTWFSPVFGDLLFHMISEDDVGE